MPTSPVASTPAGNGAIDAPSPEAMRSALATFPTGIAVVTADVEGHTAGMTINSFSSVSLDPPLVSLAFAQTSTTWPALRRAPRWGISFLSEENARLVTALKRPAAERFNGIPLTKHRGIPVISEALATLIVESEREIEAGDHVLALQRVLAVRRGAEQDPLVFFRSTVVHLLGNT